MSIDRHAQRASGPRSSTSRRIFVMPDWGCADQHPAGPHLPRRRRAVPDLHGARLAGLPRPQAAREGHLRGGAAGRRDRRRRRSRSSRPGLPHCRRDALVYPSGTTRCETCHDELAVICPMCGLGRAARRRHLHATAASSSRSKPRAVAVRATAGAEARRRRGRLACDRSARATRDDLLRASSRIGDDARRARVRGARRARRDAGQRPPDRAGPRAGRRSRPTPAS